MYVERDSRKQVLGKAENVGELDYLSRCLDLLVSTVVDAVPRLCSMYCLLASGIVVNVLVHGQVTIIFVVSVCLSVCLCRVFLSRLWSDLNQTRTHVICLGLVVSPRI